MVDLVVETLNEEREWIQKQVFTKWMNSHLRKVNSEIDDLFIDVRDGTVLIKLLEVLSDEKLLQPSIGNLRIHHATNVNIALQFLKRHNINLENIESYDIVDGNPRLILGLIWRIILRFEVQQNPGFLSQTNGKMTQEAFLQWFQKKEEEKEKSETEVPRKPVIMGKLEPFDAKPNLYMYYFLFYLIFAILSYTLSSD